MFTFSFIIPVYNAEKFLKHCLNSLEIEGNPDLQVILINDGSNDHSGEICHSYRNAHPNQVILIDKKNEGVSKARNDGIHVAEGEYLVFIDADDFVQPNYIDKLRKLISLQADLIVYSYQTVDESGAIVCKNENGGEDAVEELNASFCTNIFGKLKYQAWNKVFRNRIIQEYEITFDRTMRWSEDLDFWTRYAMHVSKVLMSNEILYSYRINSSGAVASSNIASISNHHKAFLNQLLLLECKNAEHIAFRNVTQSYVEHLGQTIQQCSKKGASGKDIKAALKENKIRDDLVNIPFSISAKYKRICIRCGFIKGLLLYFKVMDEIRR